MWAICFITLPTNLFVTVVRDIALWALECNVESFYDLIAMGFFMLTPLGSLLLLLLDSWAGQFISL